MTPCPRCRHVQRDGFCPACRFDPKGRESALKVLVVLVLPFAFIAGCLSRTTPSRTSWMPLEVAHGLEIIYFGMALAATLWATVLWRRGRA